jgi:hypothetical protein
MFVYVCVHLCVCVCVCVCMCVCSSGVGTHWDGVRCPALLLTRSTLTVTRMALRRPARTSSVTASVIVAEKRPWVGGAAVDLCMCACISV